MSGKVGERRSKLADVFSKNGAPPEMVAKAILDAVRTNPAVRTVGRDAWALHVLTKMAPRATSKIVNVLERRFGGFA